MLHTRHRVGHEILLARQADSIRSMRPDRRNDLVVALPGDGNVDSAPNLTTGGPATAFPAAF